MSANSLIAKMRDAVVAIPMKQRRRRRIAGQDVRIKNAASARNARARRVRVLLPGQLQDRRTRGYRLEAAHVAALVQHVGGDPSIAQRSLIDQAARLRLLTQLAWTELQRVGVFRDGEPRAAFDAYRRAAADEREVLRLLGLERRAQPVPTLDDYLRGEVQ